MGSPIGSPQSPSRASSVASGADSSPGRASLAGGCPEDSDPSVDGAMHAPPGNLLTASLTALVAEEVPGSPYEGVGGGTEATSADVGFSADPDVGPSAFSLSYVRSLEGMGTSGSPTPTAGGKHGGTDLERISDGGIVSLSEADSPRAPVTDGVGGGG